MQTAAPHDQHAASTEVHDLETQLACFVATGVGINMVAPPAITGIEDKRFAFLNAAVTSI